MSRPPNRMSPSIQVRFSRPLRGIPQRVNRGNGISHCQRNDLVTPAEEKGTAAADESVGTLLDKASNSASISRSLLAFTSRSPVYGRDGSIASIPRCPCYVRLCSKSGDKADMETVRVRATTGLMRRNKEWLLDRL